jgi:hypothetical protein
MLQVFMTPWRGGTPPIFALLDGDPVHLQHAPGLSASRARTAP